MAGRIKSFAIPKTEGVSPLIIPYNPPGERGTVTVICGENGVGKTYILRALKDVVVGKQAANNFPDWTLTKVNQSQLSIVRPHHHKERMTSKGVLTIAQSQKPTNNGTETLALKIKVFAMVFPTVLEAIGVTTAFDHDRWIGDPGYRLEILELIDRDEERVIPLDVSKNDFLSLFLKITKAGLGLRRAVDTYELVLIWNTGVVASYSDWSDGQKSLFSIMAEIKAEQPDVCVYDEIENFFHPKYISDCLEFLKDNVGQTILATHHPHLIFGRGVDEVYYIEMLPLPQSRPVEFRLKKRREQPIPRRRITRLNDDFEKLAFAYRLFDMRDAQLLSLAAHVENAVNATVGSAISNAFECCAIPQGASPYPDRQSQLIGEWLEKFLSARSEYTILDWGAGVGRSRMELSKLVIGQKANWLMYEPFGDYFEKLSRLAKSSTSVDVFSTLEQLNGLSSDVALLTNVLHILDPQQFAEAISSCWLAVQKNKGFLLISEIYPLLAPEKIAVPVPESQLVVFLRDLGFAVETLPISVHGCEAYCIVARPSAELDTETVDVKQKTVELWESLSDEFLRNYKDFSSVRTLKDQQKLLNWTFGIARTRACLTALN